MAHRKDIYVYIDWTEFSVPILIGVLNCEVIRGKELFSFNCDRNWLEHKEFRLLDPDLGQFSGPQYLRDEKINFGLFLDSSPDRWGRLLIKRREAIEARAESRKAELLYESDFLLGVYDASRMGALRFKLSPNGDFLDNRAGLATPPWTSIRELEYACMQFEKDEVGESSDYSKWLRMIFAPGSSLGGARPKANIIDTDNHLWIAKFPSKNDTYDMGAWEMVANELARQCGINVAISKAQQFSSQHHTFLTKRFDRNETGRRIYFASALTLLGRQDGDDYTNGVSYLDLVEYIIRSGANVDADLSELWRRIVLNIAISNCDDHLRNHGFILTGKGWRLSPAYDINPDEYGTGLKLNISENDNSLDFDLAMEVAPYFRLSQKEADSILSHIKTTVSGWREIAQKYDIPRLEQEQMSRAFRY